MGRIGKTIYPMEKKNIQNLTLKENDYKNYQVWEDLTEVEKYNGNTNN